MQRLITTTFYRKREIVKTNHALHSNNAVLRCVDNLQTDNYTATHAEVFDSGNGVLHAVVKRHMNGNIEILFKREASDES